MRTTVTLDPDVERLIRGAMQERGASFKETLNRAIRDGLQTKRGVRTRKFVQRTFDMGAVQNFRWDKALAVAEAMEDEEIIRKLSASK